MPAFCAFLQRFAPHAVGRAGAEGLSASVAARRDDGVLRTRLKELAAVCRRFGYRRLHLLLQREGLFVNYKKLYRIYRKEKLVVRKRGGRERALGCRAPLLPLSPERALVAGLRG